MHERELLTQPNIIRSGYLYFFNGTVSEQEQALSKNYSGISIQYSKHIYEDVQNCLWTHYLLMSPVTEMPVTEHFCIRLVKYTYSSQLYMLKNLRLLF